MKQLRFLPAFLLLFSCQPKAPSFTLEGNIQGLLPGDTILFTRFELPEWNEISTDTLQVEQTDYFVLHKPIEQTTFALVNVKPKGRPAPVSAFRGDAVLARPGDKITLSGSTDYIGALRIKGGFYNDSLIGRKNELEVPYNKERSDIFRQLRLYMDQTPQQQDSVQKYMALCQSYSAPEELKALYKHFREEVNDNEYAVCEYLQSIYNKTYTQLIERLDQLTPEARASYMGQRLEYMCRILKNIEVGNTPPSFTVTDMESEPVSLSDYKGKYLLIYHWGLCPGTIWVQPQLLDLYKEYHDKGFEILGFTPDNYKETLTPYADDEQIQPLLDQPWRTVITKKEGNEVVGKEYYFSGVPILMLISPEGKTLLRGYTEVFAPLKETLEKELGVN